MSLAVVASGCTQEMHDKLRANWHEFDEGTKGPAFEQYGSLFKLCVDCDSCIGIPMCQLCGVGCDADDQLPWGAPHLERVAHFGCVASRMLESGNTKFVIVAGGGKAREFVRS